VNIAFQKSHLIFFENPSFFLIHAEFFLRWATRTVNLTAQHIPVKNIYTIFLKSKKKYTYRHNSTRHISPDNMTNQSNFIYRWKVHFIGYPLMDHKLYNISQIRKLFRFKWMYSMLMVKQR